MQPADSCLGSVARTYRNLGFGADFFVCLLHAHFHAVFLDSTGYFFVGCCLLPIPLRVDASACVHQQFVNANKISIIISAKARSSRPCGALISHPRGSNSGRARMQILSLWRRFASVLTLEVTGQTQKPQGYWMLPNTMIRD